MVQETRVNGITFKSQIHVFLLGTYATVLKHCIAWFLHQIKTKQKNSYDLFCLGRVVCVAPPTTLLLRNKKTMSSYLFLYDQKRSSRPCFYLPRYSKYYLLHYYCIDFFIITPQVLQCSRRECSCITNRSFLFLSCLLC